VALGVVLDEVASQDLAQIAPAAQDGDVVETLTADRADKAFRERILPRAVRSREDFRDPQALHATPKVLAQDLAAVADEIGRCGVVRETRRRSAGRSRRRWDAHQYRA
jgi:hypothetical protein